MNSPRNLCFWILNFGIFNRRWIKFKNIFFYIVTKHVGVPRNKTLFEIWSIWYSLYNRKYRVCILSNENKSEKQNWRYRYKTLEVVSLSINTLSGTQQPKHISKPLSPGSNGSVLWGWFSLLRGKKLPYKVGLLGGGGHKTILSGRSQSRGRAIPNT